MNEIPDETIEDIRELDLLKKLTIMSSWDINKIDYLKNKILKDLTAIYAREEDRCRN